MQHVVFAVNNLLRLTNVKFSSRPIQNLLYFPQRKDLCGLLCGEAILLLNYIVDCEQVIF